MARLKIMMNMRFELFDVPVVVEVVDADLTTIWSEPIPIGGVRYTDELDAGLYAVYAHLPSGQVLTRKAQMDEGQSEVTVEFLPAQASPHENLEWAVISKTDALVQPRLHPYQLRSIWLRLWGRQSGGDEWSIIPWPRQYATRYQRLVQYEFFFYTSDEYRQLYLQIGGPKMPWRLMALPTDAIQVLIKPVDQPLAHEDPVKVTVVSREPQAEMLLSYLDRGALTQARLMAEEALREKTSNPTTAAVGAYYLLRVGDLDRLHNWTENLANWMAWLPDGPIIRAWHLLLEQEEPDTAQVRERLLQATERGLPIYTEGMRLLYDALMMFDSWTKGSDQAIHSAFEQIHRYAAALDWQSTTTTFRGRDPQTPTTERILGLPAEATDTIFLNDVTLQDLVWKGSLAPGSSLVFDPKEMPSPSQKIEAQVTDTGHFKYEVTLDVKELSKRINPTQSVFRSPDRAAQSLLGTTNIDGWEMWTDTKTGQTLNDMRNAALGE